ncbi:hypothetical protein SAY87_019787 [Trapa incisa]|uniref:GATA transcription factor n=1 Tax=Trapa incisa TaxID=236973 RepID=A0AAN7K2F0_9MYRT|nr:hypothetical protein SAY87_019787 [Trapa incisa]
MDFCGSAQKSMEGMVSALKPSLRREMAAWAQHVVGDEETPQGMASGVTAVAVEDFSVDDLLDFSNGELAGGEQEKEEKDSLSASFTYGVDDDSNSNSGSYSCTGSDDTESILAGGLAVPVDDVAELEWVSRFVDDSLSDFPLPCPVAKWKPIIEPSQTRFDPALLQLPYFPFTVPVKSRTKRSRTGRLSASAKHSDSASSASSCSAWSSSVECSLPVRCEMEGRPKKRARRAVQNGTVQFQRQCSHCGVHKTPQWRTGPFGAKTLCNACGVRYKSGRLFPEYRPACSPTFSVDIHSNSHRKVMEMRKKKEVAYGGAEAVTLAPSFSAV